MRVPVALESTVLSTAELRPGQDRLRHPLRARRTGQDYRTSQGKHSAPGHLALSEVTAVTVPGAELSSLESVQAQEDYGRDPGRGRAPRSPAHSEPCRGPCARRWEAAVQRPRPVRELRVGVMRSWECCKDMRFLDN